MARPARVVQEIAASNTAEIHSLVLVAGLVVDNRRYHMIIYLTKVAMFLHTVFHDAKSHFFLGFGADADDRNDLRRSRFMLASNFLVGTR